MIATRSVSEPINRDDGRPGPRVLNDTLGRRRTVIVCVVVGEGYLKLLGDIGDAGGLVAYDAFDGKVLPSPIDVFIPPEAEGWNSKYVKVEIDVFARGGTL